MDAEVDMRVDAFLSFRANASTLPVGGTVFGMSEHRGSRRRPPPPSRCPSLPVGIAGSRKMHVAVEPPRQHVQAGGVEAAVARHAVVAADRDGWSSPRIATEAAMTD